MDQGAGGTLADSRGAAVKEFWERNREGPPLLMRGLGTGLAEATRVEAVEAAMHVESDDITRLRAMQSRNATDGTSESLTNLRLRRGETGYTLAAWAFVWEMHILTAVTAAVTL